MDIFQFLAELAETGDSPVVVFGSRFGVIK
jgi:hypothetical protein